ncbi:MAG TPA: hypothetical protein VGC37_08715 [Friedmanniella sp.]
MPRTRARRGALVAGLVIAAILVAAIGTWRTSTGSRLDPAAAPSPPVAQQGDPTAAPVTSAPPEGDPVAFATWLTRQLLTWDTTSQASPADHGADVVDAGDPPSAEATGFAADVAAYLPDEEQWAALAQMRVAQDVTIARAYVPDQWATALQGADPGDLPDGTAAVTIEGTRHRTGWWQDHEQTTQTPVTLTVVVDCPPDGTGCRALRLSAPGRALH